MATYKVQVRAMQAADANGKAYETYHIPEPKTWQAWRKRVDELNTIFPPTVAGIPVGQLTQAKPPVRFKALTIKRGGDPLTVNGVSEELLAIYKADKQITVDVLETKEDKVEKAA